MNPEDLPAKDERSQGSGFPVPGYEHQTRDPNIGRPTASACLANCGHAATV